MRLLRSVQRFTGDFIPWIHSKVSICNVQINDAMLSHTWRDVTNLGPDPLIGEVIDLIKIV